MFYKLINNRPNTVLTPGKTSIELSESFASAQYVFTCSCFVTRVKMVFQVLLVLLAKKAKRVLMVSQAQMVYLEHQEKG